MKVVLASIILGGAEMGINKKVSPNTNAQALEPQTTHFVPLWSAFFHTFGADGMLQNKEPNLF